MECKCPNCGLGLPHPKPDEAMIARAMRRYPSIYPVKRRLAFYDSKPVRAVSALGQPRGKLANHNPWEPRRAA